MCFFCVIFFLFLFKFESTTNKCGYLKIFEEKTGKCLNCNTFCKAGTELSHDCTGPNAVVPKRERLHCIPCQPGNFSKGGTKRCKPCHHPCTLNETEIRSCDVYHDRMCVCKEGYYRSRQLPYACYPCCVCVGGNQNVNPECQRSSLHKVTFVVQHDFFTFISC